MRIFPQVAIKLCSEGQFWYREKSVYSNRMALDPATAADFMPAVIELLSGGQKTDTGEPIPPGLVMGAGAFTLEVGLQFLCLENQLLHVLSLALISLLEPGEGGEGYSIDKGHRGMAEVPATLSGVKER